MITLPVSQMKLLFWFTKIILLSSVFLPSLYSLTLRYYLVRWHLFFFASCAHIFDTCSCPFILRAKVVNWIVQFICSLLLDIWAAGFGALGNVVHVVVCLCTREWVQVTGHMLRGMNCLANKDRAVLKSPFSVHTQWPCETLTTLDC